MQLQVKKWGNSYGLRLAKADLARLGAVEGDLLEVEFHKVPDTIDVSAVPIIQGGPTDVSERHDDYLYARR